jgi:hypothetical protein
MDMVVVRVARIVDSEIQSQDEAVQKTVGVSETGRPSSAGAVERGASVVEGFSFSSTPWPLHRGHELRPLVSHF